MISKLEKHNGVNRDYIIKLVENAKQVGEGRYGQVSRVEVDIGGRKLKLLQKFYPDVVSEDEDGKEDRYPGKYICVSAFAGYKLCKNAGLPVPETVRLDRDNSRLLVTDLTDNGKFEVVAVNDFNSDLHKDKIEEIENFDQLIEVILSIADKASRKGVFLPHDCYLFKLSRNQSKISIDRVVVGDFDQIMESDPEDPKDFEANRKIALATIKAFAQMFIKKPEVYVSKVGEIRDALGLKKKK